jgi:hypothetical protein
MAEETKVGCCCKFGSIVKMLLGIVVILLGIALTYKFFGILKLIVVGCLGPFLILAGLIMIAIAKE